jgi:threonine dehydrogenase-like Zn-dependent dehydrogenase
MLAARAYPGERRFRLEETARSRPSDGEVVVEVAAAGLSHGLLSLWWRRGRIKLLPATLGHQAAGTVTETGPGVARFQPGDRVRLHPVLCCRQCRYCLSDLETMCDAYSMIGHGIFGERALPLYERYHEGSLAEYLRVPEWTLAPLPQAVSFETAAKVHDAAVALRALRLAGVGEGETVVVTAATGATGALTVRLAGWLGLGRVVAVARSRERLERLRRLDLDRVAVVALEELPEGWEEGGALRERIREAADGAPDGLVDYLPEQPAATLQALLSLRKAGSAVFLGGNHHALPIPYPALRLNGYRLLGATGGGRREGEDLTRALAAGELEIQDLITHRVRLQDVNVAVDAMESRADGPWLVVVNP